MKYDHVFQEFPDLRSLLPNPADHTCKRTWERACFRCRELCRLVLGVEERGERGCAWDIPLCYFPRRRVNTIPWSRARQSREALGRTLVHLEEWANRLHCHDSHHLRWLHHWICALTHSQTNDTPLELLASFSFIFALLDGWDILIIQLWNLHGRAKSPLGSESIVDPAIDVFIDIFLLRRGKGVAHDQLID